MREEHRPAVADPVVESDRTGGGLRLEIRRRVSDAKLALEGTFDKDLPR
jgi:hypothetical protein